MKLENAYWEISEYKAVRLVLDIDGKRHEIYPDDQKLLILYDVHVVILDGPLGGKVRLLADDHPKLNKDKVVDGAIHSRKLALAVKQWIHDMSQNPELPEGRVKLLYDEVDRLD